MKPITFSFLDKDMNKLVTTLALSVLAVACSDNTTPSAQTQQETNTAKVNLVTDIKQQRPKNIIMVVGDGMGPAYTSAYRYYSDDPTTEVVEETVFDRHLVGTSSTYPAHVSGYVTDSAASATALASGTKSYNGAIGVDVNKNPVDSVLVWAKSQGKKTGMVVTSQINHATPASYLAHNESRNNYDEIADNYLAEVNNIDVLLGGGWKYFIREDKNLVESFKTHNFHYVDKYEQLTSVPNNKKLLGLFADKGLPWALDDTDKYRLSKMTQAATKQLTNEQGFFLLVEASQVDWGGHANDIAAAMAEMDDLSKTLEYLENYVSEHPDTLVVITADHSTGGFTIGEGGEYLWKPDVLRKLTMSPSAIGKALASTLITQQSASKLMNFTLTDDEINKLIEAKANAQLALKKFNLLSENKQKEQRKPNVAYALHKAVNYLLDERSVTGWTTGGHTGVDVQVFAFGQNKDVFNGLSDNTEIAKKLFTLLGKS